MNKNIAKMSKAELHEEIIQLRIRIDKLESEDISRRGEIRRCRESKNQYSGSNENLRDVIRTAKDVIRSYLVINRPDHTLPNVEFTTQSATLPDDAPEDVRVLYHIMDTLTLG